jgi:dTDP-4-amino-4,6-dideoxygalactose transaminase
VDPETYVMTRATAEPVLSDRTRALVPVHLFGNPAPMAELSDLAAERGLRVLEDAAQAAGARLDGKATGALGDAATFSFFPSKNLAGTGDGGAMVTDDEAVAERARVLRLHGSADKETHTEVGYNSRLDELQAAGLRVLLPHLAEWTRSRREAAAAYASSGLGDLVDLPTETAGGESCWHLYVIRAPGRDALARALGEAGVGARAYYTTPLHRQPAMAPYAVDGPLPGAEQASRDGLALPMGPALGAEAVEQVVEAVRAALTALSGSPGGPVRS